ncbi:MAG: hypothetical protein KC636_01830 [Myxococcales bacterium]|nr:hypothetical protein [Myxococcales bacterium]
MSAAVLLGPLRPRDPARADSALRDACEEVNRLLWSRLGEWLAGKAYRDVLLTEWACSINGELTQQRDGVRVAWIVNTVCASAFAPVMLHWLELGVAMVWEGAARRCADVGVDLDPPRTSVADALASRAMEYLVVVVGGRLFAVSRRDVEAPRVITGLGGREVEVTRPTAAQARRFAAAREGDACLCSLCVRARATLLIG